MTKYILDENDEPVLEPNTLKWAQWYEGGNRVLKQTQVGEVRVSTVFLGLDHSFGQGSPVLWETMVFGGDRDQEMHRYSSKKEAIKHHDELVKELKRG